jgi:transcriptional regulator with XRE-family HTH domain
VPAVQDSRAALGSRLRGLRRAAGMTGAQLAGGLGWPTSKISKLENARQTPTDADLRGWARATGHPEVLDELLAALHTIEEQHAEWRRLLRGSTARHQGTVRDRERDVRFLRTFQNAVVPGLFQTAEYTRAVLTASHGSLQLPDVDVDQAVQARMRRQDVLYRADKRFHAVVGEAALRQQLVPVDVLVGQLDRLVAVAGLPTVRLGVLGFDAPLDHVPIHGFVLYDDDRVVVETFSAELTLVQEPEVEVYRRVFDRFAAAARYGRDARLLLTHVIDDLLATQPTSD